MSDISAKAFIRKVRLLVNDKEEVKYQIETDIAPWVNEGVKEIGKWRQEALLTADTGVDRTVTAYAEGASTITLDDHFEAALLCWVVHRILQMDSAQAANRNRA